MQKKTFHSGEFGPNIFKSLRIDLIQPNERDRWDQALKRHHYLGKAPCVGETLRYIATFQGHWVALLSFSAASLKVKVRDAWIGWHPSIQWQRLFLIANNTRFLILPEYSIPNLASKILSLSLKRLSCDWQKKYGHPILMVETFVDPSRFKGSCYKAAGWELVGSTRGFSKNYLHYTHHDQPKLVFVRTLHKQALHLLSSPLLHPDLIREVKPMKLTPKQAELLYESLGVILGFKISQGTLHQDRSTMALAICAIVSGASSVQAIGKWARMSSQNLLRSLRCRYDKNKGEFVAPSDSTISRLLKKTDVVAVDQTIREWLLPEKHLYPFSDSMRENTLQNPLPGAQLFCPLEAFMNRKRT